MCIKPRTTSRVCAFADVPDRSSSYEEADGEAEVSSRHYIRETSHRTSAHQLMLWILLGHKMLEHAFYNINISIHCTCTYSSHHIDMFHDHHILCELHLSNNTSAETYLVVQHDTQALPGFFHGHEQGQSPPQIPLQLPLFPQIEAQSSEPPPPTPPRHSMDIPSDLRTLDTPRTETLLPTPFCLVLCLVVTAEEVFEFAAHLLGGGFEEVCGEGGGEQQGGDHEGCEPPVGRGGGRGGALQHTQTQTHVRLVRTE